MRKVKILAPTYFLAGPISVLLGMLILYFTSSHWRDSWSAIGYLSLSGFTVVAPLLATVATYEAMMMRQQKIESWVSPSQNIVWKNNASRIFIGWAWVLICAAIWLGISVAVVYSSRDTVAPIHFDAVFTYIFCGLFSVVFGHVLGSIAKFSAPICLTLSGAIALALAIVSANMTWTSPYIQISWAPLLSFGLSTVLLFWISQNRLKFAFSTIIAIVVAAGSVASIVFAGFYSAENVGLRKETEPVCSAEGTPRICLWRDHQELLPRITEIRDRITAYLPQNFDLLPELNDFALDGTGFASEALSMEPKLVESNETYATAGVIYPIFNHVFSGDRYSREKNDVRNNLEAWIFAKVRGVESVENDPHFPVSEEVRHVVNDVLQLPADQQQQWADEMYAQTLG